MEKKTKITIIAVVISFVLAVLAFLSVRTGYSSGRAVGGEGLLLLLPVITYVVCKNISLSLEVFRAPLEEEDIDHIEMQIISKPRKLNDEQPRMAITINGTGDDSSI